MNKKKSKISHFMTTKISLRISSPEDILKDSYGEIRKPDTINYRTNKPERNGLFCEKIFGPIRDYECFCGKYKKQIYKELIRLRQLNKKFKEGLLCNRCGVEITKNTVRRTRMGHINLVVPIVHIWGFRSTSTPNKIGSILGLSSQQLDMIIYYERYVVIQPGIAKNLKKLDFLTEEEYTYILNKIPIGNKYLNDNDPNKFIAKMGAECLEELLIRVDLEVLLSSLKKEIQNEESKQRKIELFKRLNVVECFIEGKKKGNKIESIILKVLPVIPPELRPLVALDGGGYASSDLNDFYRRILIRNNRLKRLIHISAPEIILRNEKRMLQEAVDSLLDNSKKILVVRSESNRPLKSLSDSLKGKQGRFRQNLLGKRVDYSARSVIVVGPKLKLHECGLPKEIAAEIYKPFIIRKLLERKIVRTVKSAKKLISKKDPMIWNILKYLLKGHPVLLNRAPTLHRLGIQSFQPKLIEGKAILLHPLVCSAFNADFDGDQMAVHLPLSNEAILEAKLLMLASQNILNPANGYPITVPSQDMVLGLYYLTKELKSTSESKIQGEGMCFSSLEEVEIAYNNKVVDIHAIIKVQILENIAKIIKTTVGRVLFNRVVPPKVGYINKLLTNQSLREIISSILYKTNIPTTARFLDKIKDLGYYHAFKGGLSFNLNDISIPKEKKSLVKRAIEKVSLVKDDYNLGLITNNERYNKIIDIWTNTNVSLTEKVINYMRKSKQGFNSVYMMLDSGARSSKEQIRQLSGMRGLMAKPQKTSSFGSEIIENPILSNFLEGLSILEYFISTHGARKGLADTALKTADAGYLTRRLVDSAQDVIIQEDDCKTLVGIKIKISAIKKKETLSSRVLGRIALNNIYDPTNNNILIKSSQMIDEKNINLIEKASIVSIEVRSPLTCKSKTGICIKCYGRNLATGLMIQKGEAIGVIAAQSIGEPGTQLTLRTFHVGGTAGNIYEYSKLKAKYDGIIEYENIKVVKNIVISRSSEILLLNKDQVILMKKKIPYGAKLYVSNKQLVKKNDTICSWDPYNAVIIAEFTGKIIYSNIEKYEQKEKVILKGKTQGKTPTLKIVNKKNEILKSYNLPVGAHLVVNNGDIINEGSILIKIPIKDFKSGDITGGLPRLSELFEARNDNDDDDDSDDNSNNPYNVLNEILDRKGLRAAQKKLINEIQEVYRLQGVKINDKHFEVIVRQMTQKVEIIKSGDTSFLEGNIEFTDVFLEENKRILNMKFIEESGDSKKFFKGQLVNFNELKKENCLLKNKILFRDVITAISKPIIQGITKAALQTKSFLSAASFQETTKVLYEAAISNKKDDLNGLKENVILGNKIPAGTGLKKYSYEEILIGDGNQKLKKKDSEMKLIKNIKLN
ncbi:DNA-directed RNA polymerase beta' subunit [Candidatus Karelsulcia muelleri str. Sulcia-ALF]|nr:DNA-directed RNA polymerase subunit beta' [Candidatus Karelsulcia muelleri]AGS33334.1 DNA-directed RNA polymerase beta' subunit [Candidatus Karelsulcia muelleri str. Sulcia-ALF]